MSEDTSADSGQPSSEEGKGQDSALRNGQESSVEDGSCVGSADASETSESSQEGDTASAGTKNPASGGRDEQSGAAPELEPAAVKCPYCYMYADIDGDDIHAFSDGSLKCMWDETTWHERSEWGEPLFNADQLNEPNNQPLVRTDHLLSELEDEFTEILKSELEELIEAKEGGYEHDGHTIVQISSHDVSVVEMFVERVRERLQEKVLN